MLRNFTEEQEARMFFSHLKWYGLPEQYQVGINVEVDGVKLKELQLKDWLNVDFPIFTETNQELPYPTISGSLGAITHSLKFGETVSWLIFGKYRRLDNHDDELRNIQINPHVDWLSIKVKPEIIPNNSMFKVLFTLRKTKSLMKAIKNDKVEFFPTFSGQGKRTY